jgi:hypothetical protein
MALMVLKALGNRSNRNDGMPLPTVYLMGLMGRRDRENNIGTEK